MTGTQVRKRSGAQTGAVEALVDGDRGDDALSAVGADPVLDLADDLANVDQKQTFLAGARVVRDVRGQELDGAVGEDPAAHAAGEPASACVLGAGFTGRRWMGCDGWADQAAVYGTRVLSVHVLSCARSAHGYLSRAGPERRG